MGRAREFSFGTTESATEFLSGYLAHHGATEVRFCSTLKPFTPRISMPIGRRLRTKKRTEVRRVG
jgi:hypothetical protein